MATTINYKPEYLNTIHAPLLLKAYLTLSNRKREMLSKKQLVQLLTSFRFTEEESRKMDMILNQSSKEVRIRKYSYQSNRSVMINPPEDQHIYGVIGGTAYTDNNLYKITITKVMNFSKREFANVIYKGLIVFCDKKDIDPTP